MNFYPQSYINVSQHSYVAAYTRFEECMKMYMWLKENYGIFQPISQAMVHSKGMFDYLDSMTKRKDK